MPPSPLKTPALPARRRNGYTLVEILACTAIAAVLFALVGAGVGKAIKSAKTARLVSNLRTDGAALIQYAADNGQRFPANAGSKAYTPGGYTRWQEAVSPYVGETYSNDPAAVARSVFRDPLDDTVGTYDGKTRHVHNIAMNGTSSWSTQDPPVPWGASYRALSTIASPTQMMLLTTGQNSNLGEELNSGMRVRSTFYLNNDPDTYTRVPGKYYCVFVDGHLDVISRDTILNEASKDNFYHTSVLFDRAANNGAGK